MKRPLCYDCSRLYFRLQRRPWQASMSAKGVKTNPNSAKERER